MRNMYVHMCGVRECHSMPRAAPRSFDAVASDREPMNAHDIKFSVVVPVYGSGAWLGELASRVHAVFEGLNESFELLLINDASPDECTWPKIAELGGEHGWVRGFDLLYNVGQFNAIICGLERARGEFIITMDDDLQHPPEEIPKLIRTLNDHPGADCVMGRYEIKRHSPFRNAGSRLFRFILKRFYGKRGDITTSSFRIMRHELAEAIVRYRTARPVLGAITAQLTRRMINVPVAHHPRVRGRSGYGIGGLMGRTLDAIISKSTAPLRFFSCMGLCTAMFAFVLGLVVLIKWLHGGIRVAGYTSLILAVVFFSGMILLGMGIVGEYISRVLSEVSGQARYQIRQATRSP